jgi:hypothetical protein
VRGESSGEKNERDDYEANERANEETQHKGESVFLAAEVLDQPYDTFWKSGESGATHCQKLSADSGVRRCATDVSFVLDD